MTEYVLPKAVLKMQGHFPAGIAINGVDVPGVQIVQVRAIAGQLPVVVLEIPVSSVETQRLPENIHQNLGIPAQ